MHLDPSALEAVQTLALGFAFAGCLASTFELVTAHAAGIRLLQRGGLRALACVPILVFSAPFLIVRHTVREGRRSFPAAMLAGIAAGLCSLASGRLLLDLVQAG